MNVVVPLAGKDKNFEERGLCKPLVEVAGKPSIKWIAESRPFSYDHAIFIILREHCEKFSLDKKLIEFFGNKIKLLVIDAPTGGAPQSVLLVKSLIDNDEELIIDLPDQYIDFGNLMEFLKTNKTYDGIIPTFKSSYWNRGYMRIKDGFVQHVSEKDKVPISEDSTACASYFKHGKDFVWAAEKMIEKKKTAANGAYLISIAYNELIEEGKNVGVYPCDFISTLGTVEGVAAFEQHLRPIKTKKKLILHRGYKGNYLENSLLSFEMAIKENLPFEIDIRLSKDGVPFISHDSSLDRLFDGSGEIGNYDSSELGKIFYKENPSQNLASLRELCELLEKSHYKEKVFIHLKKVEDLKEVVKVLKHFNLNEVINFFACDDLTLKLIEIIKEKYPEYNVGVHLYENFNISDEILDSVDFVWADEINFKWINKDKVYLVHSFGKKFYAISPELIAKSVFNADINGRWRELLDAGVDRICTDRPKEFLNFIN